MKETGEREESYSYEEIHQKRQKAGLSFSHAKKQEANRPRHFWFHPRKYGYPPTTSLYHPLPYSSSMLATMRQTQIPSSSLATSSKAWLIWMVGVRPRSPKQLILAPMPRTSMGRSGTKHIETECTVHSVSGNLTECFYHLSLPDERSVQEIHGQPHEQNREVAIVDQRTQNKVWQR